MTVLTDEQLEAAVDDLGVAQFIEKLRRQNEARKLLRPKTTLRDYAAAAQVLAVNVAGPVLIVGIGAMLWVVL